MTLTLPDFRDDYRDESIVELVSRRPPTTIDRETGIVSEEEAAAIGMNLSGAMLRLLDNANGTRALLRRWERFCRQKHGRWPDHAEETMCSILAWRTVRDGWSLFFAANQYGLSYERAGHLLEGAFRQMRHWQQLDERLIPEASHDRDYCSTCRLEDAG